ncbi:hypothetical protein GE09DRAFT_958905 [Coniochaeta sp. 2T2.1]|nr:hypothetical protein GE09DRAFT_958905 [Coniochaeta sp. 2T2.1]
MTLPLLVAALAFAASASGAPLATTCDRTTLLAAADAYISAQASGSLTNFSTVFSPNFTYVENNSPSQINTSILTTPLKLDHRRTTADTTLCATFTELISATGPKPYVIGTQIRHSPSSSPQSITLIDSVVSTTGSWLFNATSTLLHAQAEDWSSPLPLAKQSSRAALQATADAYLDMWSNATASEAVAWGEPCARLEGGAYTGQGKSTDSCKAGIPSNHNQAPNTHRQYVIDEEAGSASVLCLWEHMMMAADSHEFRLEGGKLRFIHTMTVCPGKVCKL